MADSQFPQSYPFPTGIVSDINVISRIEAVPLILEMVKQATGMRFAAIARVTDSHWVACAVDDSIDFGLVPGGQLDLETTICHEIRQQREPVIFKHASRHPVYSLHHTPRIYQLESYVSIPIVTADGDFFGTLCAIDSLPGHFDEETVLKTMGLYAQLIAMNLDLHRGMFITEGALADANEAGRLREQFVAVLGHDLRTPLNAVSMGTDLLERRITDSRSLNIVRAIRQSTLRMGNLIEDVLDFARGKLGGGIPVDRSLVDDLQDHLAAVVLELRLAHPGAVIIDSMDVPTAVFCDPRRLAQSLSNLLGNAITHGAKNEPIQVRASSTAEQLTLSVHNMGPVIAPAMLPFLFRPFKRSEAGQREEGLGLGLYIASEIFTSHGGTLQVTSTFAEGTTFVATIPITQRM